MRMSSWERQVGSVVLRRFMGSARTSDDRGKSREGDG